MSMATLEKAVLEGAKLVFKNPNLKMKDIQEWSTEDIKTQVGELVAFVTDPGVNVAIKFDKDNRRR
jgi:hypothetical protein